MNRLKLFIPLSLLAACQGSRPTNIGVVDGHLTPCPEKPNCVSTSSSDAGHSIAPFPLQGDGSRSFSLLRKIITESPRTTVVKDEPNYMHVEFQSLILRFVDDVEFYLAEGSDRIETRSASRLGRSDLGVNRNRIEELRQRYEAAAAKP